MKYKIYVDGQEGTTGLQINERLQVRDDIEIIKIDSDKRKDLNERKKCINESDIVFLCLPDTASREAVTLIDPDNKNTAIIDASTAFRTDEKWAYGFPELSKDMRHAISQSKRIANPGCHATGFNAIVYPLIASGILSADYPFCCNSITGYSGGGRKMIEDFENPDKIGTFPPKPYGLSLAHKHIPEMKKIPNLTFKPVFVPVLGDFYKGMLVSVPIHRRLMKKPMSPQALVDFFKDYYSVGYFVRVKDFDEQNKFDDGFINPVLCNDTNNLDIIICGTEDEILISARLDNLGKGASGAAIQNMNIVLGLDEKIGLV